MRAIRWELRRLCALGSGDEGPVGLKTRKNDGKESVWGLKAVNDEHCSVNRGMLRALGPGMSRIGGRGEGAVCVIVRLG